MGLQRLTLSILRSYPLLELVPGRLLPTILLVSMVKVVWQVRDSCTVLAAIMALLALVRSILRR